MWNRSLFTPLGILRLHLMTQRDMFFFFFLSFLHFWSRLSYGYQYVVLPHSFHGFKVVFFSKNNPLSHYVYFLVYSTVRILSNIINFLFQKAPAQLKPNIFCSKKDQNHLKLNNKRLITFKRNVLDFKNRCVFSH